MFLSIIRAVSQVGRGALMVILLKSLLQ